MGAIIAKRVKEGIEFQVVMNVPRGVPSKDRVVLVKFEQQLPVLLNEARMPHYVHTEMFWDGERWLAFNCEGWLESAVEYEDDYHGPYLMKAAPPTKEELAEAEKAKILPRRTCKLYVVSKDDKGREVVQRVKD